MTSPTTRPNSSRPGGFTLVELMLVVIILGITAALAVPRYARSFDFMKLRSAAYDVAATVEHAQTRAILEERYLRLSLSQDMDACTVASDREDALLEPFRELKYELPEGIRFVSMDFEDPLASRINFVVFGPDGRCERCSIRLANREGEEYTVTVAPGLGRTRVRKVDNETP